MPNNKKKKNRKKSKNQSTGDAAVSAAAPCPPQPAPSATTSVKERVKLTDERSSKENATDLEELFGRDYPPTLDYDTYVDTLTGKQSRLDRSLYKQVLDNFNDAIALTQSPTNIVGLSRWHVVLEKLLDAIDIIVDNPEAQTSFLQTDGSDRRYLLCKVCLTIAQCQGKCLQPELQVAWAQVAVATDPTYFNAYNQLGMGYAFSRQWESALEASERAMELLLMSNTEQILSLPTRLECLRRIVRGETEKIRKNAEKEMITDHKGTPVRYWQELSKPRPTKTCAFCDWPGERKCGKCQIVYYCSRECQIYDHKQHKLACVAPSQVKQVDEYPEPDYSTEELCTDALWEFFQDYKLNTSETGGEERNMLTITCNNCHAGAVKRALMEGESPNTPVSKSNRMYPVHFCAIRNEPGNAVEVMRVLLRHGACPNVIRPDGKHLIAICRERARWIDDTEPSTENTFFRLAHLSNLEEVERQESNELVEMVSKAIQQHKLCRLCKARKQNKGQDAHLKMNGNLTDELLAQQESIRCQLPL